MSPNTTCISIGRIVRSLSSRRGVGKWETGKLQVSDAPSDVAPGLIDLSKFKGMRSPKFYEMDLVVDNSDGGLSLVWRDP